MAPATKKINFHASFNSEKRIFNCEQNEAADEVASHFGINLREVILYSVKNGKRSRISPDAISDLMHIEIISNSNGQRTIQACLENGASKKMVDSIVSKLQQNHSLTGIERRALIEALQTHSTAIFKRKLNQTDENQPSEIQKPAVHNKKLQVVMPGKESFTQTDPVNIPLSNVEKPANNEENARYKLKRYWNLNDKPSEEIDLLMKDTFDERRKMIIADISPVKMIKEQFPFLFCVEQVKNELDRIFYPGKCAEFLNNMNKYTQHILYYKEDGDKVKEVFDIIAKARDRAKTPVQKSYAEVVGSVFLLAKLLDEDFGFIHLSDYPLSEKEDAYPHIDGSAHSLEETFLNEISYSVIVEGQFLCKTSNFPEAILCLVASFFIFNIVYPENCNQTFIAFEKLYLDTKEDIAMDEWTLELINFYKKEADGAKKKILN